MDAPLQVPTASNTNISINEVPAQSFRGATAVAIMLTSFILVILAALTAFVIPDVWADGLVGFFVVVLGFILLHIRIISPGQTLIVQFFGSYKGTLRADGLHLIYPLHTSRKISVRVRNFETATTKVNDLNSNPITIGAIVVWQITDTAKAHFAVEEVEDFIQSQAESALRHVATTHPYDSQDVDHIPSLSGSTDLVSEELAREVAARAVVAGIDIIEARISSLSYSPEIAQAMLRRQQASAIVDARETIVEGAVSMVDSALEQIERRNIVDLDPERRAAMVSNLLVVLCSDTSTQPVVNAGSLYS
ncbi:SPFH domain-containing protein [Corynebacterium sp. ES2775-CONJ]|uniref:SPFH domain-containing protein n=1 Tax=Corynebacterium sp. ES2775-CONJ TaxID=2974029 RepID=UPI0037BF62BF